MLDMLRVVRAMLATGGVQGQAAVGSEPGCASDAPACACADTYTYAAAAAVALGLHASAGGAAGGPRFGAAMAALAGEDAAVSGGATILAGQAARLSAAAGQPELVEAVGAVVATTQTLWLWVESVRRSDPQVRAAAHSRVTGVTKAWSLSGRFRMFVTAAKVLMGIPDDMCPDTVCADGVQTTHCAHPVGAACAAIHSAARFLQGRLNGAERAGLGCRKPCLPASGALRLSRSPRILAAQKGARSSSPSSSCDVPSKRRRTSRQKPPRGCTVLRTARWTQEAQPPPHCQATKHHLRLRWRHMTRRPRCKRRTAARTLTAVGARHRALRTAQTRAPRTAPPQQHPP